MCKIIELNGYRGNKEAKKIEQIRKEAEKHEQRHTGGLSTEALVKEFVKNGQSVFKLIIYIIEQYGYLNEDFIFEDVKRDIKYCDICPEINNKRFKAPLGVKIKGEWYAVEVITSASNRTAFRKKWETIGNYNVKGFCVDMLDMESKWMKRLLDKGNHEECLPEIVEGVHRSYFYYKSFNTFEQKVRIMIDNKENGGLCVYKMLELSLPDYIILEGMDCETKNKHFLLLYREKKHLQYFCKKYESFGVSLFCIEWDGEQTWRTVLDNSYTIYSCSK